MSGEFDLIEREMARLGLKPHDPEPRRDARERQAREQRAVEHSLVQHQLAPTISKAEARAIGQEVDRVALPLAAAALMWLWGKSP